MFAMTRYSQLSALRLLAVLALLAPALWSCNTESAQTKFLREQMERFKSIDEDTIQHYLTRNKITNYQRLESGLYLVPLVENSQGAALTTGRRVSVKYVGRFLSNGGNNISNLPQFRAGAVFENTSENRTDCGCAVFLMGGGFLSGASFPTTPGFSEGMQHMRVGERKLFIIPSRLAFGPNGQYNSSGIPLIYSNSVLLYDVEVLALLN